MRRLLVVVLASAWMWSCGTDTGPASPSSVGSPAVTVTTPDGNVLTATIDGAAFNGVVVLAAKVANPTDPSNPLISVSASSGFSSPFQMLQVAFPASTGTYPIDPLAIPGAALRVQDSATSLTAPMVWATFRPDAGGTITVTALTSSSASGTFSLTLQPLTATGATAPKTVTNGVFDVKF
jgi:hypothetical protein